MSTPSIYKDGTITVTQDSAAFTGADTAWTTQLKAASLVFVKVSRGGSPEEFEYKLAGAVAEISADGAGTFDEPCPLDTVAVAEYFAITWNSGAEIAAAIRTLMTEQVSKGLNKNVSGVPLAADYREGDFVRDRDTGVIYTKDQGAMVALTAAFANAVGQWAGSEARFALSIAAGQVGIDIADGEVGEDGAYYYSLTVDEAAEVQLPLGAAVDDIFDILFTQSGGGNAVTFAEGYSIVGSVRTLDTERSRMRFTVVEVEGSPEEASAVTGAHKTYLQNDMVTDRGGTYISTQDLNDAEPQIDAEDAAEDSAYWLAVLQVGPTGPAGAETVSASSTTSLAIGTGTKVFTLAEATTRGYVLGTRLRAASDASPNVNWMEGPVTAYAHPSITIDVELTSGAGTLADWSIGIAGEQGPAGGGLASLVDDVTPQLGGMLDPNGNSIGDGTLELLSFEETASAVNELTIKNAATGNPPELKATGDNANIDLALVPKGTGSVNLQDAPLKRPKLIDYGETVNAIGSTGGGTQDIDLTLGNVVSATVDTSENTFTFSNPPASGVAGSFTLILTNGGSQTVNWPASVDWAGGAAPDLTVSGVDILTFITIDGGTTWYGFPAGLEMS